MLATQGRLARAGARKEHEQDTDADTHKQVPVHSHRAPPYNDRPVDNTRPNAPARDVNRESQARIVKSSSETPLGNGKETSRRPGRPCLRPTGTVWPAERYAGWPRALKGCFSRSAPFWRLKCSGNDSHTIEPIVRERIADKPPVLFAGVRIGRWPNPVEKIDLLAAPELAGGCLFPVDRFVLEPVNRLQPPGFGYRNSQLGMPDHDSDKCQPRQFIPRLGRTFQVHHGLQGVDRSVQRPRIGQLLLNLFESERVAIIHQLFVASTMHAVEPRVERVGRIVVLVALDAPVAHFVCPLSVVRGPLLAIRQSFLVRGVNGSAARSGYAIPWPANNGPRTTDNGLIEQFRRRQKSIQATRGRDERRDGDRRAAHHFGRAEPFAFDCGDLAAGFGGDDDPRGNVVSLFAQEDCGLKAAGGHECLFTAGAPEVAQATRQSASIDGSQGIGAHADVVLIVKLASVVGMQPLAVEPGPAPFTAQNSSLSGGMTITPRTGSPATIRPMLMAQSGRPWTRLPVPSIGSIDQRRGRFLPRIHIPRRSASRPETERLAAGG